MSVRTRIAALALIPLTAFALCAVTYTFGARDIAGAFASVKIASAMSDASRQLKTALVTMRSSAREFSVDPSPALIKTFDQAYDDAVKSLETIEGAIGQADRSEVTLLWKQLASLKQNFGTINEEQKRLGFTGTQGLRADLKKASNEVERVINRGLSSAKPEDQQRLALMLTNLRRFEAEYRVNRSQLSENQFFEAVATFNKVVEMSSVPAALRDGLVKQVQDYGERFRAWMRSTEKIEPLLVVMDLDSERMLPRADQIIDSARARVEAASGLLAVAQSRTEAILFGVGFAAIALCIALSWRIGRGITQPMSGLAAAMERLANGDTSAEIPATDSQDEIGAMARTVIVFRNNAVERERLTSEQAQAHRAREQRTETIAAKITHFENSVDQALTKVRDAAHRLETAASALNRAADQVSSEAQSAETRVGAASTNVTTAANSAEELSASIAEIASQAAKSTEVAGRAVIETKRTVTTMAELAQAATRIGEVIGLIQAIAGQTNLLALNATIEAARAGEAGKGFAVVASEVKSLAGQTARATEDIAAQIGAIQTAAGDSTEAIGEVNAIIDEMSRIATSVAAAVDEQNIAIATIAEGVNLASADARSGAEAISKAADASQSARQTAVDVKALSETLAAEAESLDGEVRRFLADVRAA